MKKLTLVYLDSISDKSIETIEDIIRNERLIKHLWIELILNPEVVTDLKPYIERIEAFAKARGESIELLLVGGLALSLYGLPRYTIDIDGEIKCVRETYFELIEYLQKDGAAFNLSGNISGWGIGPLPAND